MALKMRYLVYVYMMNESIFSTITKKQFVSDPLNSLGNKRYLENERGIIFPTKIDLENPPHDIDLSK